MKRIIQLILLIPIAVLVYFLVDIIMTPINFNKEYDKRKASVVNRLRDIRTMQVAFKSTYGHYTSSFDSLIDFYKNGNIKVVRQIGSMDDSLAVAQGLVKRDTIFIPVKDTVLKSKQGFDIDQLPYVPYTDGAQFELKSRIHLTISKIEVPLFQASVLNKVFLAGLDQQEIVNLDDKLEKMDKFKGLKVGDVEQPNNNAGNWE